MRKSINSLHSASKHSCIVSRLRHSGLALLMKGSHQSPVSLPDVVCSADDSPTDKLFDHESRCSLKAEVTPACFLDCA